MPNLPTVALVWEEAQGEMCLFYRALGFGSGVGPEERCGGPVWGGVHLPLQETDVQVKNCGQDCTRCKHLLLLEREGTVCVQQKETKSQYTRV